MGEEMEKILKESLYSLDKLTVEFAMLKDDMQRLMDKYSMKSNVSQWESKKLSVCRYNYSVEVEEENSFYIGFSPNWKRDNDHHIKFGRVEFNPAKVGDSLIFLSFYNEILCCVSSTMFYPVKFDLAIDIPVARHKVYMMKDKRT
jgi:hypothetical protein